MSTQQDFELLLDDSALSKLTRIGNGNGKSIAIARHRGTLSIPFIRIGRRIRYKRSAVLDWLEAHTVTPDEPAPERSPKSKHCARRTKDRQS